MGLGGLSVPRWSTLWRALTGWRGSAMELEIPPELRAYICLGDPDTQPDWYLALGVRLWGMTLPLAAGGAGVVNHIAIVNPTGSGVVSVIQKMWTPNNHGATGILLGPRSRSSGNPPAGFTQAAPGTIMPLDLRNVLAVGGGSFQVSTQVWSLADAVAGYRGVTLDDLPAAANGPTRDIPIILAPGDACVFDAGTANVAMALTVLGYERDLDTGERRS